MTGKIKRIDVHSHVLPRELIELIRQRPRDYEMRVEGTGDNEKFVRDDQHGTLRRSKCAANAKAALCINIEAGTNFGSSARCRQV